MIVVYHVSQDIATLCMLYVCMVYEQGLCSMNDIVEQKHKLIKQEPN